MTLSPFLTALQNKNYTDFTRLVDQTPDPSLLHLALTHYHSSIFSFLLAQLGPHVLNGDGLSCLAVACQQHLEGAIEQLLTAGARIQLPEINGQTCLMMITGTFSQASRILQMLRRSAGTSWNYILNWRTIEGDDALMMAVRTNQLGLARALIGCGINLQTRNYAGQSALDLARQQKKTTFVRNLMEMGVDNPRSFTVSQALKSINWTQLTSPGFRTGIIPYVEHEDIKYFLLGQDARSGDLSDFGGKFIPGTDQHHINGALRELWEETRHLINWTPQTLVDQNATVVYNNDQRILIIFTRLTVDHYDIIDKFKTSDPAIDREMETICWIPQETLQLLAGGGSVWFRDAHRQLYSRVAHLIHSSDILSSRYSVNV